MPPHGFYTPVLARKAVDQSGETLRKHGSIAFLPATTFFLPGGTSDVPVSA